MASFNSVTLRVSAKKLDAKDRNGLSDPYFVIREPTDPFHPEPEPEEEPTFIEKHIELLCAKAVKGGNALVHHAAKVHHSAASAAALGLLGGMAAGAVVVLVAAGVDEAIKQAKKLHPRIEGWKEIFVSEVIKKSLDPEWRAVSMQFTDPSMERVLLIEVYDWERIGKSRLIGSCKISQTALLVAKRGFFCKLHNDEGKHSGTFYIQNITKYDAQVHGNPRRQA